VGDMEAQIERMIGRVKCIVDILEGIKTEIIKMDTNKETKSAIIDLIDKINLYLIELQLRIRFIDVEGI